MNKDEGTALSCPRCRTELRSGGVQRFRTGGTRGALKLVFGEWAELGEGTLPLEVLVCPSCKYVELYAPDAKPK